MEIDKRLFEKARCSLESLILHDVELKLDLRIMVQKFPNLKVLDLHLPYDDTLLNLSPLSELCLKVLDLGKVGVGVLNACDLFANHSPLSQSIEELDLSSVLSVNDDNRTTQLTLNRMAASCSNLVKLKIDDCGNLPLKFSTYFTSAHFPHLKELSVVNTEVKAFHNCHMPTLERLSLGSEFTKMTDHTVLSILRGCPALVYLYAADFKPSASFFSRWEKIGRNCERAWEASLEIGCSSKGTDLIMTGGCYVELGKYVKNLGLAWKFRSGRFFW